MIEWFGAKIVGGSEFVQSIAVWADAHPLVAVPFGIFLLRVFDNIVKMTPTKYDDLCLDIFADAIKAAFTGAKDFKARMQRPVENPVMGLEEIEQADLPETARESDRLQVSRGDN